MSLYLCPEDQIKIQIKPYNVQVWWSCTHLPWWSRNTCVIQKVWCVKMGSTCMNLREGMLRHEGTPTPTCPASPDSTGAEAKEDANRSSLSKPETLSRFQSLPMSWDFSTLTFPTCVVTAGNEVWPRCYLSGGSVQNIWCVSVAVD